MQDTLQIPAPFDTHREAVRPEWIDYNGHMNVAYYVLVFDHAIDAFLDFLRVGERYRAETNHSTMSLECHITYQRELRVGETVRVTSRLVGADPKRLHILQRMYHAGEGYLASTYESVSVHVDLARRKSAFIPEPLQRWHRDVLQAHSALPPVPELGRSVGLSKR